MGNYELFWGRPLKSILAIFDGKKIDFNFYHLKSSNYTIIDKDLEEKKILIILNHLIHILKKSILIDQDKRKLFIENED